MLTAAAIVFFPYTGFDAVANLGEETCDPGRDLPLGLLGTLGLATVLYVGVSLVVVGMGRDGLLPQSVAQVSPRTGTPARVTLVMATFVPLGALADLVSIGTLFAFLLVSLAVVVLRRTRPDMRRPFRVPLSPVLPVVSALACLYLMTNLSIETWLRFLAWLAIGLVIYVAYGYRNSPLRAEEREPVQGPR